MDKKAFIEELVTDFTKEWSGVDMAPRKEAVRASFNYLLERLDGKMLPEGFKVYKCTDCGTINVKHDNGEIEVGFCDNCDHPLWN